MLSTVLVLGYGDPPEYRTRLTSCEPNDIASVHITDDFRIQSHSPQCLLDLAKALVDAAELLNDRPITTAGAGLVAL